MRKKFARATLILSGCFLLTFLAPAQTVRIYCDLNISQQKFAATDILRAVEGSGEKAELLDISSFEEGRDKRSIVMALQTDLKAMELLSRQGGEETGPLGEQAFAIRSTGTSKKSYWVVGGDINGVMYGGLELAELIFTKGLNKSFSDKQSPYILRRGIKYNIPFDRRSPTYYGSGFSESDFKGSSTKKAIEHMWDLDFWSETFDQWTRQRYNALSLWSLHPFTSMIKMTEYPEVAIENVQGFDGFNQAMSMDEKIEFWRQVMRLAKNRGFEFYLYNWNIYTYGATGKYGIDNKPQNPNTMAYMRECMTQLFETYPDLTGFGVTAGENMEGISDEEEARWTWETYGRGVYNYASLHPDRQVVFIHRYHDAGGAEVAANFEALHKLPNVRFDFSFKYAVAHIYSTTTPNWIRTRNGDVPAQLSQLNKKTWLELRNDSFYYLHWGDPDFVKRYLAGFPDEERYVRGFFMGSDGHTPTYVFNSKADWTKGLLEIQRNWFTWTLWGRLSYNPAIQDEVFENLLQHRYPESQAKELFSAWKEASAGLPLFTELIQGTLISDFKWYPETCMSRRDGFVTLDKMIDALPPPGSDKCSIAESAVGNCGNKKSSYEVADEIEAHAKRAISMLGPSSMDLNTELGTNLGNIRAMAYLSLYYAEKARGATHLAASRKDAAKNCMGRAREHWLQYSALMDALFFGMELQRTRAITTWSALDADVLKEYTSLGGDPAIIDDPNP